MADATITFTMQIGTIKAEGGDKYGELTLQKGWYIVTKQDKVTNVYGPIDTEALAIVMEQEVRSKFYREMKSLEDYIHKFPY